MSEAIVKWVNQKTANFFRDYKEQPEPEVHPNLTCRGTCRLLFLLVLTTMFALSVAYVIYTGPGVRVYTMTKGYDDKFLTYILEHGYDKYGNLTNPDGNMVSCACKTTAFSWKNFTNFYILNENSTIWHVEYDATGPRITSPIACSENVTVCDLRTHIVRAKQEPATPEMFCSIASMWPLNSTILYTSDTSIYYSICAFLSGKLLANNQSDNSEILLQSPILLAPAVLRALVIQQAQEPLLITREEAQLLVSDAGVNAYNDAITLFLLDVLGGSEDVQDWQSYLQGARQQEANLNLKAVFRDPHPQVLVLNNSEGIAFLHMDVNWTRYYDICSPMSCDVTEKVNALRKVIWGFASVGGFMTVVLGVVNIVLWPAISYLLSWLSPPNSPMEAPNPSESEGSGLLPHGVRSDESELVSVSIAPGGLPPLEKTKSTQRMRLERIMSRGRETQGSEDE